MEENVKEMGEITKIEKCPKREVDKLLEKKADVEVTFQKLNEQLKELEAQKTKIFQELLKLQGAHRCLVELIKNSSDEVIGV